MNYKYHLLKYSGKASRLTCPSCGRKHCFVPYVDNQNNIVGEEYGRCNHESSCGYFKYPPSDYITLNVPPVALSIVPLQKRSLSVRQSYDYF